MNWKPLEEISSIWFYIRGGMWAALGVGPPQRSALTLLLSPSCAAAVAFTITLNMQVKQKHKVFMFVSELKNTFLPSFLPLVKRSPLGRWEKEANLTVKSNSALDISVLSAYVWRAFLACRVVCSHIDESELFRVINPTLQWCNDSVLSGS